MDFECWPQEKVDRQWRDPQYLKDGEKHYSSQTNLHSVHHDEREVKADPSPQRGKVGGLQESLNCFHVYLRIELGQLRQDEQRQSDLC